ncbi:tripartite motif-containing protein 3-like [Asterias rubens]|uniref:tripartite motif-containing protein 3-like n=1 Tax=Asterias rubens TaxID=7604 RepID=UPI00145558B9|nr:tripartite motif-containing protein 3-like [Asterias rubens]
MENKGTETYTGQEVNKGQLEGQGSSKKWSLKTEITRGVDPMKNLVGYCTEISVFSDGDIIIADNGRSVLVTLNAEGQLHEVKSAKNQPDTGDLTGVTVNKEDQILILENQTIKIFSRSGEFIREFTTSLMKTSYAIPTCITVDDGKGHIAVGDEVNGVIHLFDPDGAHIVSIIAKMIGDYLTVGSKQNFLYTDFHARKLLSIDDHGNALFTVNTVDEHNKPIQPCGVCCDSNGDIYISAQTGAKMDQGEIHHFDPEGKYKGRVISGLKNPFGIAFTPSGGLVVADGLSVKIFCYM